MSVSEATRMYKRYMSTSDISAKEMALEIISLARCTDINPHDVHRDIQQQVYGTCETTKLHCHYLEEQAA